jgi:hypothetical protein
MLRNTRNLSQFFYFPYLFYAYGISKFLCNFANNFIEKNCVMKTGLFKRLPYGNPDFGNIITQGYACIDKTRFTEDMKNEPDRNCFSSVCVKKRKTNKILWIQ